MKTLLNSLVFFLVLNINAYALEPFQDQDRVCFVGDSITHAGSYHSYIYLYYLTRFPDREIRVINKGLSGDQSRGALNRFSSDIAVAKPTVTAIMLGMNDVGRNFYGIKNKSNPKSIDLQKRALDRYRQQIPKIMTNLQNLGSQVILITPSIYDQTMQSAQHNYLGVNDALAECRQFILSSAQIMNLAYVDFYKSMLKINAKVQSIDPRDTIISKDRVHPTQDLGHFIMAYEFLKSQKLPQYVSKVTLDKNSRQAASSINSTLSKVKIKGNEISFNLKANSLPFPETPALARALKLVPFTKELNQELIIIKNLEPGQYTLSIDAKRIASFSASDFANGVNLSQEESTPQYQQALEVSRLNESRRQLQLQLRDAAFTFYTSGLYKNKRIDLKDPQALKVFLDKHVESKAKSQSYKYHKMKAANYLKTHEDKNSTLTCLENIHKEIYATNKPKLHCYKLSKQK